MIKNIYGNKMLIIVDHKNKRVMPCDLKTSSHKEYEFYKSFTQWRYDIQARLYWRLIRSIMDEDDYFKDFELDDYRFIVATPDMTTPLVWGFEHTKDVGDITIGDYVFRDPEEIGRELSYYLQDRPVVPRGIKIEGVNRISEWLINDKRNC